MVGWWSSSLKLMMRVLPICQSFAEVDDGRTL
jgi:hypothetical protein